MNMQTILRNSDYLDMAHEYAKKCSGCTKVQVGSVIVASNGCVVSLGANAAYPDLCKARGCLRVELYGENAKSHRLPGDCRALHSEVAAICNSAVPVRGCSIFVTRYPCEACARAIVAAGIREVVYGREQRISEETARIFSEAGITPVHESSWVKEDSYV